MADLSITLTILDANKAAFKAGFLRAQPVPVDANGDPTMSDLEWIKAWGISQYLKEYKHGAKKLAADAALTDDDIIS